MRSGIARRASITNHQEVSLVFGPFLWTKLGDRLAEVRQHTIVDSARRVL